MNTKTILIKLLLSILIFGIFLIPFAIFNLSFARFLLTYIPYLITSGIFSFILGFTINKNRLVGGVVIFIFLSFITLVLIIIKTIENQDSEKFAGNSVSENQPLEAMFEHTFNYIRTSYIKTDEINWENIEENVKDSISHFNSINDVVNATEFTLTFLGDRHSQLVRPGVNPFLTDSIKVPEIRSKIIDGRIGYLKIPGLGANDSISRLFALEIKKAFKKLDDSAELDGWIIDLKDNIGGHSFAQILGISPLLHDSILGYSLDNKGNFKQVICHKNVYSEGGSEIRIDYCYFLRNRNKKIAILINERTASCGESVALNLRNHAGNTRIFGQPSRGLFTGLTRIDFLPSGASLLLSVVHSCDAHKNIIDGPVNPDVIGSEDEAFEKAIRWIYSIQDDANFYKRISPSTAKNNNLY
jgi:carboxyl-terminal processing protease